MDRNFLIRAAALPLAVAGAAAVAQSSEPGALCTDRPTRSNFACVVEPGHFQYESDLANGSRLDRDGTRTDTWTTINPTLKYGLAKDIDIEVNWAPWVRSRTREASGVSTTTEGVGDTYLRLKWNFAGGGDNSLTATLLPYVKAPTARRGIGNRAVEGGLLLPINYQLTDKLVLTTVPQVDWLKDPDGSGRHLGTTQLVNLGITLPHDLTLYGELWASWNFDHGATVRQRSADLALAWGAGKYLQFDAGLNFGLNRETPNLQGYIGISQKF